MTHRSQEREGGKFALQIKMKSVIWKNQEKEQFCGKNEGRILVYPRRWLDTIVSNTNLKLSVLEMIIDIRDIKPALLFLIGISQKLIMHSPVALN